MRRINVQYTFVYWVLNFSVHKTVWTLKTRYYVFAWRFFRVFSSFSWRQSIDPKEQE